MLMVLPLTLGWMVPGLAQAQESVWQGVYTNEQATRGETLFAEHCSVCHGEDLEGDGFSPPLTGTPFDARWTEGILGDFMIVVKATMPQDSPGNLTDGEYAAIVAFILKRNDFPSGQHDLTGDPASLSNTSFQPLD